jgi:hypothetical protein
MGFEKGNTASVGNNGGSPPYYEYPAQMKKKCDEFFEYCKGEWDSEKKEWKREPEPPTITGLALWLGFNSRQSLLNYQNKPEFVDIITNAKTKVEMGYEKNLHGGKPTGSIFALSNMGWRNEKYIDHSTKGEKINPGNTIITGLSDETLKELASKLPTNKPSTPGADS